MKKIILSISILLSGLTFSQDFHLLPQDFHYKQLSPYWRTVKAESGTNILTPFQPLNIRNNYYKNNVDTNLVKQLVYDEFRQFQNDYNANQCIKTNSLHNSAQQWAYEMKESGFRHSTGLCNSEDISNIHIIRYTCIYAEQGDINKIVARSLLDSFVKSKAHMDSLLSPDVNEVGIGLVFFNDRIYIVVQLNR
jgi:uncharacterized protein YkwD